MTSVAGIGQGASGLEIRGVHVENAPQGDGGPALDAFLASADVGVDRAGNLYVADDVHHRIRRVDANTGIITTVAGSGVFLDSAGFAGAGGPATLAKLNNPIGIEFDLAGNLYIADAGNLRVRKVDAATGIISTVAGSGPCRSLDCDRGDGGPAVQAELAYPTGLALDRGGNLYIAETLAGFARLRKVDKAGTITTLTDWHLSQEKGVRCHNTDPIVPKGISVTAPANAVIVDPYKLSFDADGNLLIADRDFYGCVWKLWAEPVIEEPIAEAGERRDDYPIPSGHFYSQARGNYPEGFGYTIRDGPDCACYSRFLALGGVAALGYPVSRPYRDGPFVYQATERALLQWNSVDGSASLANVLDLLSAAGKDDWLEEVWQIPKSFDWSSDARKSFDDAVRDNFSKVLEPSERDSPSMAAARKAIAFKILEDADWLQRYGLPMSIKDYGPVVVMRAQRSALQYWKVDAGGGKAGSVTVLPAGETFEDAGLIPADALEAELAP